MTQEPQKISHCHKKIREVAIALAEESYEAVMGNNWVRAEWKRQHPGMGEKALIKSFVSRNWPRYIPAARTTLTLLLRSPIDDKAKEEIMEVLTLDATLIRGRQNPAVVMGALAPQK